jgi:hypothetical protein
MIKINKLEKKRNKRILNITIISLSTKIKYILKKGNFCDSYNGLYIHKAYHIVIYDIDKIF